MQDRPSTLLLTAQDTDAARLLAQALLERGGVAILSPIALPEESYAGATLLDARKLQPAELSRWAEEFPATRVIDLGAIPPESLDSLRRLLGARLSHYLYCSSTAVYAPSTHPPITENSPLLEDESAALLFERRLEGLRGELPFTIVRSSPVYGEGRGLLAYFFDRFLFGDGVLSPRPIEDAVHPIEINDWIAGLLHLLDHPSAREETFNLVGKEWLPLQEFLSKAAEAAYANGRVFRLETDPSMPEASEGLDPFPLPGEGHQIYSGDKLKRLCGFEPQVSLATGLEQGFIRYLEQAGAIEEPNLGAEKRIIEHLALQAQLLAPPPEPIAEPEPEVKAGATQMGAPTRLGVGGEIARIRRPRDPNELPPPPLSKTAISENRLDEMADLMLSGVNREGENEMQVEMKDEILGGLHIKIAQKQRRVRALFGCKQRESRALIEESLPELRRKLEQRGYFVLELVAMVIV